MALVLNKRSQTVSVNGRYSRLTQKEYGILSLLIRNQGKMLTAESIYRQVWHCRPYQCKTIISVHIRHIREKIEKDPSHPEYLKMLRLKGYWMTEGRSDSC